MNYFHKLSAITVSLLIFVSPTQAQSVATLKDSIERAILTNPEVRFKHKNLMAVTNEQDAAKGGWLPRVDLESSIGSRKSVNPEAPTVGNYGHSGTSLLLRQILFDGFATSSDVRRLGHARLTSYYELLSASDQIGLETARAYIDVLRHRELVKLASDNYASHAEVYDRLEEKLKAGVGRKVDLEQAAGRKALAESNWLTEVSNLHDVTARYQRLVGQMPSEVLAPVPDLTPFLPTRDGYIKRTVINNPDFKGAVSTIRAFRADLSLRNAPNYPTLELRANVSREKNRSGIDGNYRDSGVDLVLNYNLYRGGSDSARIEQFTAKLASAYELRDKTCRDVRQTALIALNDAERLSSQIEFLAQHELSTSKAREAYRQQFDIAQRSLLDLLDTENELFQARRALVNAEKDHQLAKARVLAVNGALLGALQLRPLETEAPPTPKGLEDGDGAVLCDTDMPSLAKLDKSASLKISSKVPPPAPAPKVPSKVTLSVDTLFDFDKADLKPEGIEELKSVVTRLKSVTLEKVAIIGHTDSQGPTEYNDNLSLLRARSVSKYLVSQGIDERFITTEGRGMSQPIADNNTLVGRAKNRRVEIMIHASELK
jgi:outer membrane protein, adhesin transport system